MVENGREVVRGVTYEQYVNAVGEGEVVSRRDMAARMNVCYHTAMYHLDRAVALGYLNRQHGYASERQPGWVYALPATMPRLEGEW